MSHSYFQFIGLITVEIVCTTVCTIYTVYSLYYKLNKKQFFFTFLGSITDYSMPQIIKQIWRQVKESTVKTYFYCLC